MSIHPEMLSVNIGLLGAANITRLVWASMHRAGHCVTLVGCRDTKRGTAFVTEICDALHIPDANRPRVTTYEEVVSSPKVDLVFLPIPVTAREKWVRQCVKNGKHVIGEKPPATSADQLRAWVEALDARELLYMDGTMLSHSQRVRAVAAAVKKMGPIRHMQSTHCLNAPAEFLRNDIRMDPALEPHGALGDLGWYSIRYFLHVMDMQMPTHVTGRIIKMGDKKAVVQFSGELTFGGQTNTGEGNKPNHTPCNKTIASLFAAFDSMDEQTLTVAGTKGVVRLRDMCHPISGHPAGWTVTTEHTATRDGKLEIEKTVHQYNTDDQTESQRDQMWIDIAHILYRNAEGKVLAREAERRYWAELAWKTQAVMDRMLESARQTSSAVKG